MARGRMLNATIATDNRLARLSLEAEYLYLKSIPHLDRDGLILGDATVLWARVCPRRIELMPDIDALVQEWQALDLVIAYSSSEGQILYFPTFTQNQAGLRYDREPASTLPVPPHYIRTPTGLAPISDRPFIDTAPEDIRQSSGSHPADVRQAAALREVKLREVEVEVEVEREVKLREVEQEESGVERESERETRTPPRSPPLPAQIQAYIDNGGKFPTGKLVDGTSKRERAIHWICERVADDAASLERWGRVVAGYCAQWSPKSYTVMVNEYYLTGRVPGEPTPRPGPGNKAGIPVDLQHLPRAVAAAVMVDREEGENWIEKMMSSPKSGPY